MLDSGEYSATVSGFGYQNQTKSVTIPEGVTEPVVLDFQLENLPSITVKGVVTDGGVDEDNKHGYPLYAKITFSALGTSQVVYTDPITGAYEVVLPTGHQYIAKVESMISGYEVLEEALTPAGETEFVKNYIVSINSQACVAPGYGKVYDLGLYDFESGAQGFTFGGNNGSWAHGKFTPIPNGPTSAHSGQHGIATNPAGIYNTFESSWAMSPVIDLSTVPSDKAVVLEWWQWLYTGPGGGWDEGSLEFTNDGTTWTPV